ncbi:uncharacterized protein RBU57_002185 [Macrochelys suwanniensis]
MIQFCGDLESYFRRLRLKEYFQQTSVQHTNPQNPSYQNYKKKDSAWTPPEGRNNKLDFYIDCFRRRARAEIVEKQNHLPHNLSRAEHNAINSLRNNSNIIIKKADKGGAVVIMNKLEYEQEAVRQLCNSTFYRPLSSDPTEEYQKKLHHLLQKLPGKAQEQICTDTFLEPRPGAFYLLPKIHKPGNPGRPIISGIGTLTAGLSGYIDSLLRPYATSTPSYLRDTTDFLRKLQSIGDLPDNTILATMDVEALYTNIPHNDGLQAVRNSIPDTTTANLVAELCDFVLTHNYFTFGDNIYLQVSGTAMGTRMAPQYANIFMADLEQRFLSSRHLTPLLYLRYIDDIFIIWTHGKEKLTQWDRNTAPWWAELGESHLPRWKRKDRTGRGSTKGGPCSSVGLESLQEPDASRLLQEPTQELPGLPPADWPEFPGPLADQGAEVLLGLPPEDWPVLPGLPADRDTKELLGLLPVDLPELPEMTDAGTPEGKSGKQLRETRQLSGWEVA